VQRSGRLDSLPMLAKELPVHGDEQLLTMLPQACIAADGFDHVEAGLVVATGDRQVAEQSGQSAGLELQGTLQVGDLGGDRQRPAALPLRYRGVANADHVGDVALRQAALLATLTQHAAELFPLLSRDQARHLVITATQALANSIAQMRERAGKPTYQFGSTCCRTVHNALGSVCADLRPQGGYS
jgi:hypothetical protein